MTNFREVLTTRQAAQLLGLSTTSIQKLVIGGELEAWITPGGHRRVFRDSVEKLALQRSNAVAVPVLRNLQVLVTAQDVSMVEALRAAVSADGGFRVDFTLVSDAAQALILVERLRPDLVLTDLVLQPFDGFQLIKTLSADEVFQDVPVAVVTGLDSAEIASYGQLPPWVSIYRKPLDPARLLGYLDALRDRQARGL